MTPLIKVNACLLSLASNTNPEQNLACACEALMRIGQLTLSPINISPCHLKPPTSLYYHNQMAYLVFNQNMIYSDLVDFTKQLEQTCQRNSYQKPIVKLDIDIIAIDTPTIGKLIDEKGDMMVPVSTHWYAIARRLPLASYDNMGLSSLLTGQPQLANLYSSMTKMS